MKKDFISIGEAIWILRVDRTTLYRWEKEGLIIPYRNHKGKRFYTNEQIEKLKELRRPKLQKVSRES